MKLISTLFLTIMLIGCGKTAMPNNTATTTADNSSLHQSSNPYLDAIVVAINVGGDSYVGVDGVKYAPDNLNIAAPILTSPHIKGTQDSTIFESYRQGNMSIDLPLSNGTYDITFKFAEPYDTPVGERIFDVLAQNKTVIEAMDVRLARDGKAISALVRTANDIVVTDDKLRIGFKSIKGEPLLHAIIVRKQITDSRDWQLVWNDEFDYQGAPDPLKWSHDLWAARKVNDEDQAYTDRAKNSRVEDGRLVIEAHKESYDNAEYTSARLHNLHKGDILYGKVDVRAKIPAGRGTWSAIWMLPSDPYTYSTTCAENEDWQGSSSCDAWPNSGEIDIMEHVGYDMQTIHGTVHNKAYYWINWEQRKASVEGKTVDQEFHLYSLEWSPTHIIVSLDKQPYFYYHNEGTGWQAWPFDKPFHLIMNLAIGGQWGRSGGPIDDSIFPVRMEVDYVRIYQLPTVNTQ
jgi:beta-glucanase (GH16 family)